MIEISLSVVNRGDEYNQLLASFLGKFEKQTQIRVNVLQADVKRSDLKSYALYKRGPDVSEIATTWLNDMVGMNALRPLADHEMVKIGRPAEFPPGAWRTCRNVVDDHTWAIPFLLESVIIHYRSDLLAQAGLDPRTAFASLEAVNRSAEALAQSGVSVPVEMPYWSLFDQLHALSGWLWSAGADYVSADGKRVLFDDPRAVESMRGYLNLIRYYSPEGVREALLRSEGLFRQGKSAVLFSTHVHKSNLENVPAEVREHWGVASYPAEKYIGGSNLAIWNYSRHGQAAVELIQYLTSSEVQLELMGPSLQLPSRMAALLSPRVNQDALLRVAAESAMTGRSYLSVPMWGLIEERLINALHEIQLTLLKAHAAGEELNVETAIRAVLEPLAQRINLTLSH